MGHTAWPTHSDLLTILVDTGLIASTDNITVAPDRIGAAVAELEKRTGRMPFLAETQTRYFDPPGPNTKRTASPLFPIRGGGNILVVDNGFTNLVELKIGRTDTYEGTTLSENSQYYLRPVNAASDGTPYEAVEFIVPIWGPPQSVVIEADWGWGSEIPDDVWNAVLERAAAGIVPVLSGKITGGVQKVQLGINEFTFGTSAFASTLTGWDDHFRTVIRRYMR